MSFKLNPGELVLAAAIISIYIAQNRTLDEIDLLGNLFETIGTNLLTLSSAASLDKANSNDSSNGNDNCNSNDNQ